MDISITKHKSKPFKIINIQMSPQRVPGDFGTLIFNLENSTGNGSSGYRALLCSLQLEIKHSLLCQGESFLLKDASNRI